MTSWLWLRYTPVRPIDNAGGHLNWKGCAVLAFVPALQSCVLIVFDFSTYSVQVELFVMDSSMSITVISENHSAHSRAGCRPCNLRPNFGCFGSMMKIASFDLSINPLNNSSLLFAFSLISRVWLIGLIISRYRKNVLRTVSKGASITMAHLLLRAAYEVLPL